MRLVAAHGDTIDGLAISGRKEHSLDVGMFELGRMGTNTVRRLLRASHRCVGNDLPADAAQALAKEGAVEMMSLEGLANKRKSPGAVWLMVPTAYADVGSTLLRHPVRYRYDLKTANIAEVWRRGGFIASGFLQLTTVALLKNPGLARFTGRVSDSGEGQWTVMAAIDESVRAPVLSAGLHERFDPGGVADFADRVLSALRCEFGGHEEMAAAGEGGA